VLEAGTTHRKVRAFSSHARRITVLLLAGFAAFQLGKNEITPAWQLAVATAVALIVAIALVPHTPRYVRKPKKEFALTNIDLRRNGGKPEMAKRAYSPPSLTQLESRVLSEPVWEPSGEDESFRTLRPFYVVYSKRDFTVSAVCLKFDEDRDYQGWQPVATVAPQDSDTAYRDENYQWILIGYVPPGARFDAKLKLRDSQSGPGTAVVPDLVAFEDRPFQSVYLKLPSGGKHFVAHASD